MRKRFGILSDRLVLWILEATCQNIGRLEVDHMRAEASLHSGSVDVVLAVARDLHRDDARLGYTMTGINLGQACLLIKWTS